MKMYEVTLSQDEIDAIWLLYHRVSGKGKYYDCIIELGKKLEPFVSENVKNTPLINQVSDDYITFTGRVL